MTSQVCSAYAAIAFGLPAPATPAQLGSVPQIAAAVSREQKDLKKKHVAPEIALPEGGDTA
jgi:hypothetical protein